MNKIVKDFFKSIALLIMVSLLAVWITLCYTPNPLFTVANLIPIEANLTKLDNYLTIEKSTKVERNIVYSEQYPNSLLDIYSPIHSNDKLPVVLFVHGGGFFKGEKEMAKYFGRTISSNEYAFISINYDLVPNATVFDQVKQINDSIQFITDNADEYSLDIDNINLAGSSAGGFLALQLLSSYHNEIYAKKIKITPVEKIKFNSLLLYSAVYDLSEFQHYDSNFLTSYLLSKIGWGLTGERSWESDSVLGAILNQNNYINKDFPSIFITDGNTNTFTEQATNYSNRLEETGVFVQTLFFNSREEVGHGYQLNMHTSASKKAVKESLNFLERVNK